MKKMFALLAAVSFLTLSSLPPVFAAPAAGQTCPVTGDVIKSDKFSAEYKGKTYYFCCKGCVKKFNKNPARFISENPS